MDASQPPPDSGFDAGRADAGAKDAGFKPDAGSRDAGFVDVPISDWCRDLALVQCERDVRCLRVGAENLAECMAKKSRYCDAVAYTRAVNEGRLQYLKPKAAECLNAHASGSCEDSPPACAVVFAGQVVPDGGCILDVECNDQGFCYQYDLQCPHHCRGWVPMGQSCDGFTTRCKPDEGYCGTSDGGTERCLPLKGAGEDCDHHDACRTDLYCADSKCVKRQAGPGESCGERSGFPFCSDEYFCRQSTSAMTPPPGVCERRGGLGAVCTGYGSCLPSLRCGSGFATATCRPRAAEGEPCSTYGDCQETLFCPTRTSRCQKVPGAGGDCSTGGSYFECASSHFCDFNSPDGVYTCRALHALGEACSYDGVCQSNECLFSTLLDAGSGYACVASCAQSADGGF